MPSLAKAAKDMRAGYDVVVVGSGYGGGVAASRLARAGLSVCVLERGREFLPGDFPDTLLGAQREFQINGKTRRFGSPTALFDMRLGEDVHVLSGCGLGGTSLINANVCLMPHAEIFHDTAWPSRLRCDHWLNLGFARANEMLRPQRLPEDSTPLKLAALQVAAEKTGQVAERAPLHIAFADGATAAGVAQRACTLCGDCMSGCNVGAKTTVHSTYLTDAVNHGAEIFTEASVRFLDKLESGATRPGNSAAHQSGKQADDDGYRWRVVFAQPDGNDGVVGRRAVMARTVIVAAGTLGSAEIMMRSQERGLKLSAMLGKRFCTNADAIAVGFNNDILINGIGTGRQERRKAPKVGPGVSGMIDLRAGKPVGEQLVIVEAAIQSALAPLLPLLFAPEGAAGAELESGIRDKPGETARKLEGLALAAYLGASAQTQTFLAVGHDDRMGEIAFRDDRVHVDWPDAAAQPVFERIEQALRKVIAATGGTYVPNPVTTRLFGGSLMTVQPLGGCVMGKDVGAGVVDHKCRVFDGAAVADGSAGTSGQDKVHEGLYICDGSVIPRSLGAHPLLTITAIAERAMALLLRDKGLRGNFEADETMPRRDFVARTVLPARPADDCTQ